MSTLPDAPDFGSSFYLQAGRSGCLLIHGFTGTPYALRGLGKALYKEGITVHAPCLPGHGTKPKDLIHISYLDWIETARLAVRQMQKSCDHVFVAGLSMGGTLALYLASEMDVQGCIGLSTPILGDDFKRPGYEIYKHLFQYWPKWRSLIKSHHRALGYRWYPLPAVDMFIELLAETRSRLPRVNCPVLLMHSPMDSRVPFSHMDIIYHETSSVQKRKISLTTKKHAVTLSEEREMIFGEIIAFINQNACGKRT